MKKTITIFIMIFVVLSLQAARRNFLDYNFKDHWSYFVNFHHYQPADTSTQTGIRVDGTINTGGFGYFLTPYSMLSLSYGNFDVTENRHKVHIIPILLELSFYRNLASNWKLTYGAGFGTYKVSYQPIANGSIYSQTDLGFCGKGGLCYLFSETFSVNLEAKYLGNTADDVLPGDVPLPPQLTSRDVRTSDWTFGIGFNFIWK